MKTNPSHLISALVLLAMAGCANTTTPHYDQHIGEAVRTAIAQQTINPDAASKPDSGKGMDGKAAVQTMDNYDKSFAAPEKSPTLTLSVGGN